MVFNGFLHQVWLHHRAELGGVQLGTSGVFLMSPSDVTAKLQPASTSASQEPQIKPADLVLVRGVVQVMMASDAPSDGLSGGLSDGLTVGL